MDQINPLMISQILTHLRALWRWGGQWPGNNASLHIDDVTWRSVVSHMDAEEDFKAFLFARKEPWIRRVVCVEMRWRLVRALLIGAAVGAWLGS